MFAVALSALCIAMVPAWGDGLGRSIFSAIATQERTVTVGQEYSGILTDDDLLSLDGRPFQVWALDVSGREGIQIDLRSVHFDTLVYVVGPGLSGGIWDDDSGGKSNSRICFAPDQREGYRVVVSSFGGRIGSFSIAATTTPTCGSPALQDGSLDDIAVVAVLRLDQTWSGTIQGDERYFEGRPLQALSLEGTAGDRVALTLTSDQFDTYLYFEGPGFDEPLSNDDGDLGSTDARICVELPETGTYRVFAGAFSAADQGARYRIHSISRGAESLCRVFVRTPASIQASFEEALSSETLLIGVNEERSGSLTGELIHPESDRPIEVWTVYGEPGASLYVDLVASTFDAYLIAMDDDDDILTTADDHGDSTNARMELRIPGSGKVTLLASAYDTDSSGDYLLRTSFDPPPPEDRSDLPADESFPNPEELQPIGDPIREIAVGTSEGYLSHGSVQVFTYEGHVGAEVAIGLSVGFENVVLTGRGLEALTSQLANWFRMTARASQ